MTLALVDCNSFYCSCELIFRPEFENRPVVVLSNNDGCVVARNKLAKLIGIKMAVPLYQIRPLIEKYQVKYFSSNYALYGDISKRVMTTLSHFTPEMEVYSIDEAFLNLSGFEGLNLHQYALEIKNTVFKNVHIPVSVGIGPTKVLAKVANHIAKKSEKSGGVVDLSTDRFHKQALQMTLVEDIWGIGRKSAAKLRALGIKNALEFRDYKNEKYILKLLTKVGLQIKHELQGHNCIPLELFAQKKKQIISSRTFGQPVFDLEEIQHSVATYITTASEKLRKQDSVCSMISVYIRTNPFKNIDQYYNIGHRQFISATNDTRKLIKAGFDILFEIYRHGYEYKKSGIILSNINDRIGNQLSFLGDKDTILDQMLMETMDLINQKEGPQTLKIAACGTNHPWKMARHFKSPSYTTRWSDILRVK